MWLYYFMNIFMLLQYHKGLVPETRLTWRRFILINWLDLCWKTIENTFHSNQFPWRDVHCIPIRYTIKRISGTKSAANRRRRATETCQADFYRQNQMLKSYGEGTQTNVWTTFYYSKTRAFQSHTFHHCC